MVENAPKKCLVIGDINIDFAIHARQYPAEGGEAQTESADLRLGGSGCLTALWLQLNGTPTALAASMGADVFSRFADEYLVASGIDRTFIHVLTGEPTGFFMILVTPGGQRTMFGNRGANAAACDAEGIITRLDDFCHVHISGYSLLEDDQYESIRQVVGGAKSRGLSVSLDPGIRAADEASEKILALLSYVDYFLPSREELGLLADGQGFEEKASALLAHGTGAVLLKMGDQGARYFEEGFSVSAPVQAETGKMIVDTTGAGDCFNAGFITGRLTGRSPADSLKLANAAAYRLITSPHGIAGFIKGNA